MNMELLTEKDFIQVTKEDIYAYDQENLLINTYVILPKRLQYLLYLKVVFVRISLKKDSQNIQNINDDILIISEYIKNRNFYTLKNFILKRLSDPNFFRGFENEGSTDTSTFNMNLCNMIINSNSYDKKIKEISEYLNYKLEEPLNVDNFNSLKNYEFVDNLTNKKYKLQIYELEQETEERTGKGIQ